MTINWKHWRRKGRGKPVQITGARQHERGPRARLCCIIFLFLKCINLSIVHLNPFRLSASQSATERVSLWISAKIFSGFVLARGGGGGGRGCAEPAVSGPAWNRHSFILDTKIAATYRRSRIFWNVPTILSASMAFYISRHSRRFLCTAVKTCPSLCMAHVWCPVTIHSDLPNTLWPTFEDLRLRTWLRDYHIIKPHYHL